jgi:hypothetical protein
VPNDDDDDVLHNVWIKLVSKETTALIIGQFFIVVLAQQP